MRLYEVTEAGLAEMEPVPFKYEHQMRDFVADNIGVLFPDLEKVKNEMNVRKKYPDTVAYDSNRNTFVVIEYKNKKTKDVVGQVMDYMTMILDNRDTLRLEYKDKPRDHTYDWNAAYSIILAPSFDQRTQNAAKYNDAMELYTIKKYGRIIVVERAGGGHGRQDTPATIIREQPTGQQNMVGKPLATIQYQKGMKCEGYLTRNSERKTKVSSWVGLLVAVMNEVNPREPIKGGERWLVNHTPQHDNGKKFQMARQLDNGMWLEAASKAPSYILKICNRFPVAKELGLELH